MPKTTLTISSKNYSSWSLRGWLLARFAGLEFDEVVLSPGRRRACAPKCCCWRRRCWCPACATTA